MIIYHGESTITHDGEGRIVKEDWGKDYIYNGNPTSGWDTTSRSIYSTVLGGEIASIEENFYGVMEKTRVYAGGAVIGEQQRWTATGQSTGETYSHIFRDPVSGSVIRGGLEEHYEPLGQKINPIPPLEEPTFPGPNDGFNDARFPEWQCKAAAARYLSDSELPAHCQRAAEQRNIAAKIDVTWPAWPEKDGNALKPADSPLFNGAGGNHASLSFATRTMSASLTTTAKRFKDDDPDCGTTDCTVTVTADLDIPDFKDASVSDDLQQQIGTKERLNEEDQKQYEKKRGEVRNRLGNISKKCLDLLTKAGLTVKSVLEAVNLQNAYDGPNSTVSTFDAGGIDESGWEPGSLEINRQFERDRTISKYFADQDGVQARTMFNPGGKKSDSVAGRSDVYFRNHGNWWNGKTNGFNRQTTILHEALHSLTGLSDEDLYTKLTGKTAGHVASSMGVSQALKDNGCTK